MRKYTLAIALLSLVFGLGSCKKDKTEDTAPTYTVPTTYNFSNVNYADVTTRLGMVAEIETEMNKGQTMGTVVDAQKLKDMFANVNNRFSNAAYNTSGLQIKNMCTASSQADIEGYMDVFAQASTSTVPASNGVAGVATSSSDASKHYLLTANGFNNRQIFSKTIMVALITNQVNNAMMQVINKSVDNSTITNGTTAMEHLWDEAFGYWNVPIDFPANKKGVKYFGSYSSQVDSGLHCNATLMNAFLKGRAAISNKDMTTAAQQANIIMATFDQMAAAAAIHELHEVKEHFSDDAQRNSVVSESWAFVHALKYNNSPTRKITSAQIDPLLAMYGTNLYDISLADFTRIIDQISSIYGFDSFKDAL